MQSDIFGPPYEREATHDVVVQTDVRIPLRDGVQLAADLYLPAAGGQPAPGRRPTLLLRTPYDRHGATGSARYFAQRGYAVALQDVRGRHGSDGEFYAFAHEGPDGYDTIEWLAAQPWCDGQVGTFGQSYEAAVQSAAASLAPPHLAAMVVTYGPSSYYHSSMRHNGALEQRFVVYAFSMIVTSREAAADPALKTIAERAAGRVWDYLQPGAVRRGETALRHFPTYEQWCLDLLSRAAYDDWWRLPGFGPRPYYDQHADVPTLYVGGWYDSYTRSTVENYLALAPRQRTPVHLLMGPWHHGGVGQPVAGDATFAPDGGLPHYDALRLQWFDQFLLGLPTALATTAPVKYYVMGGGAGPRADTPEIEHGGEWRGAGQWPPPEVTLTPYYLHGDGRLDPAAPADADASTAYVFDPTDPVPSIGGQNSAINIPPGAFDQRQDPRFHGCSGDASLADRPDVLVFTTPPLAAAVELAGPVTARLWVSTDGPDTDFTAKLLDVYPPSPGHPDGVAMNLTDSIARLRFRNGYEREELAVPGEVYELVFELYPTANHFAAGHQLRVDISSSNWPRFDLNPNTGGPLGSERTTRPATNRLYHDRSRPSHLVLPVMAR